MPASNAPAALKEQYLGSRIDEVLARSQPAGSAGISLLVVKDGQTAYRRSMGLARTEGAIAIGEGSVFELASLSKTFTAIAVMQLVERAQLRLDDPVTLWLPALPASWRGMTIHHLLSHQSGIADYINGIPISAAATLDGIDNGAVLRQAAGSTLKFLPGNDADYSNTNYVLLAQIVAAASGQRFADYVRKNIFEPASLTSTFSHTETIGPQTTLALNYASTDKVFGARLDTEGPTGIRSTTADLRLLIEALLTGKLVSPASLAQMTRPQSPYAVLGTGYGYGFQVSPGAQPLTVFEHSGTLDGYRNQMHIDKTRGFYYILLSNGGDASAKILREVEGIILPLYTQ